MTLLTSVDIEGHELFFFSLKGTGTDPPSSKGEPVHILRRPFPQRDYLTPRSPHSTHAPIPPWTDLAHDSDDGPARRLVNPGAWNNKPKGRQSGEARGGGGLCGIEQPESDDWIDWLVVGWCELSISGVGGWVHWVRKYIEGPRGGGNIRRHVDV